MVHGLRRRPVEGAMRSGNQGDRVGIDQEMRIEMTDFFLTLMIFYQKDVLNYGLRHLENICFEEEKDTLKKLSEKMAQNHIEENITNMLGLKGRLKYNINNKLAFDKMLACLERGYKYATYCSSYTV